MKKYIPILVVIALVLSIIGIARGNPVWASPKVSTGVNAPLRTLIDITANGTSNVGGVCDITADFKTGGAVTKIQADAEAPIDQSKVVPYNYDVNVYGNLLFPGCHFVFYDNTGQVINQIDTSKDSPLQVCFGASPQLVMNIFYYLDTPASGRQWIQIPSHLDQTGHLICTDNVIYTGVYMPTGMIPPSLSYTPGENAFFPSGLGGTVLPPPSFITITGNGTYAVGGMCLLTAQYYVTGLSDTVQVMYPTQYTQNTKTVPFNDYINGDLLYFPGCHVLHYMDITTNNVTTPTIQKEMTSKQGDWQICFAAIPSKTMTIYYYLDDTVIPVPTIAPLSYWTALTTTTANGMACADLVNFSAVYAPAGK
jgi:hypothetical protein